MITWRTASPIDEGRCLSDTKRHHRDGAFDASCDVIGCRPGSVLLMICSTSGLVAVALN